MCRFCIPDEIVIYCIQTCVVCLYSVVPTTPNPSWIALSDYLVKICRVIRFDEMREIEEMLSPPRRKLRRETPRRDKDDDDAREFSQLTGATVASRKRDGVVGFNGRRGAALVKVTSVATRRRPANDLSSPRNRP